MADRSENAFEFVHGLRQSDDYHWDRLEDLHGSSPLTRDDSEILEFLTNDERRNVYHDEVAARLDEAAPDPLLREFLESESRIQAWLKHAYTSGTRLATYSMNLEPEEDRRRPLGSPCRICRECHGDADYERAFEHAGDPNLEHAALIAHNLNISLAVLAKLATRPDAEKMLDLFFSTKLGELVRDPSALDWNIRDQGNHFVQFLTELMHGTRALAIVFPTTCRLATALQSLVICRRPTLVFSPKQPPLTPRDMAGPYFVVLTRIGQALTQLAVNTDAPDSDGGFRYAREYVIGRDPGGARTTVLPQSGVSYAKPSDLLGKDAGIFPCLLGTSQSILCGCPIEIRGGCHEAAAFA